jgi:molecular chaperone GrpE
MAVNDNPNDALDATAELESLRAKLAATEMELSNYKLRLADFENARKRLLRDVEVEKKYAIEPFVRDLLAAFDNLDRALGVAKTTGEIGPLAAGVAATASQFLDVLRRHGVNRIDCGPGTVFDPNLHEAVMQQPSNDFTAGHVIQVLQQGFTLHDRVIRPATVIVAAPSS